MIAPYFSFYFFLFSLLFLSLESMESEDFKKNGRKLSFSQTSIPTRPPHNPLKREKSEPVNLSPRNPLQQSHSFIIDERIQSIEDLKGESIETTPSLTLKNQIIFPAFDSPHTGSSLLEIMEKNLGIPPEEILKKDKLWISIKAMLGNNPLEKDHTRKIKELVIEDSYVSPKELSNIFDLCHRKLEDLESFSLKNNQIFDEEFLPFSFSAFPDSLKNLSLNQILEERTIECLCRYMGEKNLKSLDLSHAFQRPSFLDCLPAESFPSLTRLSLRNNNLGDRELGKLLGAPFLGHLNFLDFSYNCVTLHGLGMLQTKQFPTLTILLDGNNFSSFEKKSEKKKKIKRIFSSERVLKPLKRSSSLEKNVKPKSLPNMKSFKRSLQRIRTRHMTLSESLSSPLFSLFYFLGLKNIDLSSSYLEEGDIISLKESSLAQNLKKLKLSSLSSNKNIYEILETLKEEAKRFPLLGVLDISYNNLSYDNVLDFMSGNISNHVRHLRILEGSSLSSEEKRDFEVLLQRSSLEKRKNLNQDRSALRKRVEIRRFLRETSSDDESMSFGV